MKRTTRAIVAGLALALLAAPAAGAADAKGIPAAAGVRGGLVVHVGCGDGKLTAALHAGEGYLVHGLDSDPAGIAEARRHIRRRGLYGKVSVDTFDGRRLPYVDNLVNLVVAENLGKVPMDEVMRVLAPNGVAYVRKGSKWAKTVKPRPGQIDEWTHYLHGPDNNVVAADSVVGPPRHMQWLAGPNWTRHHHWDKGTAPGIRAMVSAGGRLYYMVDRATAADIRVPARWFLVARDAFSGVELWRNRLAVGTFPRRLEQLWRGLVADGDRLYAALGPGEPLSVLDGATGKVIRTYAETRDMEEVIKAGGSLFAMIRQKGIVALAADTGRLRWRWQPPDGVGVVPLGLAASGGKVFLKTDKSICALAADTGKRLWRFVPEIPGKRRRLKWPRAKLVAKDGVVLCSYGGKRPEVLNRDKWQYLGSHPRVNEYGGTLAALSADDGEVLWKTAYKPGLESYPGEIYVIDGLVWLGPDFAEARDLRTGKVRRKLALLERLWTTGHHHRCYPGKATSRYILTGKRGVEMFDLKGDNHSRNNWLRGTCRLGVTPCNGLLYAPSHSCGCYMEAKLYGFWALAATAATTRETASGPRLQKGPAFGKNPQSAIRNPQSRDWPTYRHDAMRSGSASTEVPGDLGLLWRTKVGARITPPVIADGRLVVADIDSHRIVCLDAKDGRVIWSFTAGGRVDSPPTIHRATVLAGCADGWVYCLDLADGRLAWRFLAAPRKVNTVAFDQVESLWPVQGSVLVKGGVAYVAAGRSSYLDGGIMVYGLDAATGKVLCKTRLRSEHPGTPDPPPEQERSRMRRKIAQNYTDYKTFTAPDRSDAFSMSGARNDIMVADENSVYLRQLRFDSTLNQQKASYPHLLAVSSLLDGAEIHRSHWVFGTGDFTRTPVAYSWIAYRPDKWSGKTLSVPYGLMLAFDDRTVWGVRRNHLMRWKTRARSRYILFAQQRPDAAGARRSLPDFRKQGAGFKWTAPLGLRPRAMVRAGESLFIGGMPDRIDPADPSAACNAAFEGRKGGLLHIVSCSSGKTLGEKTLDAPPVWDGMAAAGGRLYLVDRAGRVLCLGSNN